MKFTYLYLDCLRHLIESVQFQRHLCWSLVVLQRYSIPLPQGFEKLVIQDGVLFLSLCNLTLQTDERQRNSSEMIHTCDVIIKLDQQIELEFLVWFQLHDAR